MSKSREARGSGKSSTALAKRVVELREHLEGLERDKARLEGEQGQILRRLKEEHGCPSLKEGRKLLTKLDKEVAGLEEEFGKAMEEFEAKWSEKLEGAS